MDADQIEKIAKDANDTSTKAYNLLLKTLDGEGKTSEEIEELNRKYVTLSFLPDLQDSSSVRHKVNITV